MKKLLSIALTGAIALSAGAYYIAPAQQTSLTANAYDRYEMLEYRVNGEGITIEDCLDIAKGEIVVPEMIDHLPVTIIYGIYDYGAFSGNKYITSVILPKTIDHIYDSAFRECSLETISMQRGLETIGDYTFADDYNLKFVEIPDSVTSIGREAFNGCTSLAYIMIKSQYCDIYDAPETISENAIIYGYENSTAQAYAEIYGREFRLIGEDLPEIPDGTTETTETTKGDVNGDNSVTIADAVAILQYLANSDEYALSEQGLKNADVLGDDGVNTEDALQIQKLDAGVIDKL